MYNVYAKLNPDASCYWVINENIIRIHVKGNVNVISMKNVKIMRPSAYPFYESTVIDKESNETVATLSFIERSDRNLIEGITKVAKEEGGMAQRHR